MTDDKQDVDPEDFLRALLKISPEDAEKVRQETFTPPEKGQDGPTSDYGHDDRDQQ